MLLLRETWGILRLTSGRMLEQRLRPPNPNEVTIGKSFQRPLMFFPVFIMTRSADDVSHQKFPQSKVVEIITDSPAADKSQTAAGLIVMICIE